MIRTGAGDDRTMGGAGMARGSGMARGGAHGVPFSAAPSDVLARLAELRAADAPTHGGRVLAYVFDSGVPELDELAAEAARLVQPVNGLDPTTFGSVAVMEREVVGFARRLFGGDEGMAGGSEVVGSVTSGGTESCLLAVKTARDAWRARGGEETPRLVAPVTAHAAFRKAAKLFGLVFDGVPVDPATGAPDVAAIEARLGPDVALLVASAPSYPFATLDPVLELAAAAARHGVDLHVDACIGGFALAFVADAAQPAWDFRVPGVTSLSADLHKYGYAPKGVSVLLQRGRDRQRRQYFAAGDWPGYPVVNPTLAGSKPAGPLAAAWAIVQVLGEEGLRVLASRAAAAASALQKTVRGIEGLRVVGTPAGPLFAVATDDAVPPDRRVDPHQWADAVRRRGFVLQPQPAVPQADDTRLPRTTHLTVTPVTARVLPELEAALREAADEARGVAPIAGEELLAGLTATLGVSLDALSQLDSDGAFALLGAAGVVGAGGALPGELAPVLALVEALPAPIVERLLVELLARLVEP